MFMRREGVSITKQRSLAARIGMRIWFAYLGWMVFCLGCVGLLGIEDVLNRFSKHPLEQLLHGDLSVAVPCAILSLIYSTTGEQMVKYPVSN
jgi:hypothetical protein